MFNTLSYDRNDIVEVDISDNIKVLGLIDTEGKEIDIQYIDKDKKIIFFAENVPSKGYKTYTITDKAKAVTQKKTDVDLGFENEFFKVVFDKDFNISSLYDKENNREVIKSNAKGNVFQAFEDRPMQWENWDIDIYYKKKMWEINDLNKCEFIEKGPIRFCLKIDRKFCDSSLTQYIYFYKDIPRIDFKNCIEWKEKNILLKVAFPVDINSNKATYEIQYGNIERETHNNTSWDMAKFEVCAHKWADLS